MTIIDESLYDEFGNYIGQERERTPEDGNYVESQADELGYTADGEAEEVEQRYRQEIVLHEDKKYYLTAEETYGPDVETLVQEEDTQPLTQPVIEPSLEKNFQHTTLVEHMDPFYDLRYLHSLMAAPERVRNVAICGQLHHGKTSLIDLLIAETHGGLVVPEDNLPRYMDYLVIEQERGISLRAKPLTLLLPTLNGGPSLVANIMDTPGHLDFSDEVSLSLRMADGVILVVDALEGMMVGTEETIKESLANGLSMILVLNKLERLWLELKLPPIDAYYKIRHSVEELNTLIATLQRQAQGKSANGQESSYFQPEKGNVLFASTMGGWMFSLQSFAEAHILRTKNENGLKRQNPQEFSRRLWGEIYWNRETGRFTRNTGSGLKRSFVSFILEPLYKLYGALLAEEGKTLQKTLANVGISISLKELNVNTKLLIRRVFGRFFSTCSPFNPSPISLISSSLASAMLLYLPNPQESAFHHVIRHMEGPLESPICRWAQSGNPEAPVVVAWASKSYPFEGTDEMEVLMRVMSGTLQTDKCLTLFEGDQQLDVIVEGLYISGGRYRFQVDYIPAGNWALIRGVNLTVDKTAIVITEDTRESLGAMNSTFKPLKFRNIPLLKLAIEPLIPSELPKMKTGLKSLCRAYSSLRYHVEDSGEHHLLGTGELYLDCAMHDLRRLFADIEIKVADPVAKFAETVAEMSYIKCFAESPNGRNRLTFIAEPLEKEVLEALQEGRLPNPQAGEEYQRDLAELLRTRYGWDILASRSVWAFGPDPHTGPCMLVDDTLPEEVDRQLLAQTKDAIIQGFQWACREGPLIEETVRGVRFKLIDAILATMNDFRTAGQIIPTVRRACYAAMLTASPRIMEPVRLVEIQTQNEFVEAVYAILAKRRGHVIFDTPKAGTPFYVIRAYLPLMDSFGFETDLRIHTQGMAFCLQRHDHWQIVTGDPLDASIRLIPLEPSPAPYLARDYLLKTRRRKGLSEDVKLGKFLDEAMLAELEREEAISGIKGLEF